MVEDLILFDQGARLIGFWAVSLLVLHYSVVNAATLEIESRVVIDGTPLFDLTNDPGMDSSANNDRVRTNDVIRYRVDWNSNDFDGTGHTVAMQLSDTARWVTVPPTCLVPGSSISADRHLLICLTGNHFEGTNGTVVADAEVLPVSDGELATMNASASDNEGGNAMAGPLDTVITSVPQVNIRMRHQLARPLVLPNVVDPSNVTGLVVVWPVGFGPEYNLFPPATSKGTGPIDTSFTFVAELTSTTTNTRLVDFAVPALGASAECGAYSAANGPAPFGRLGIDGAASVANSTVDSGTWTCTPQPMPSLIEVAVVGAQTSPASLPEVGANGLTLAGEPWQLSGQIATFTPNSDIGSDLTLTLAVQGFDPAGLGGVGSNYGVGVEPAFDNSTSVTIAQSGGGGLTFNREINILAPSAGMVTYPQGSFFRDSRGLPGNPYLEVDSIPLGFFGMDDNPFPLTATAGLFRPGDSQLIPGDDLLFQVELNEINLGIRPIGFVGCVTFRPDMFRLRDGQSSYPLAVRSGDSLDFYERIGSDPALPAFSDGLGAFSSVGTEAGGMSTGVANWLPGTAHSLVVEYGDAVFATVMDQRASQCLDGDSPSGWEANPADLPGGIDSVSMLRFRIDDPDVYDAAILRGEMTTRSFRTLRLLVPVEVAPTAGANSTAYVYMNGGWFDLSTPGMVNWRAPGYDHTNHQPGLFTSNFVRSGDRAFVRDALVVVDKSSPTENQVHVPGQSVDWVLDIQAAGGNLGVVVVDTLPAELLYVPGSAVPAPTSVVGQVLTWNLGDLVDQARQITYTTITDVSVQAGATITNPATVSNSNPVPFAAADSAGISIREGTAEFFVSKSVQESPVPTDTDLEWELAYENTGEAVLGDLDLIDVIPFLGDDAAGTGRLPVSDFQGDLVLSSVVPSDAGGELLYTVAASGSISLDPQDLSNMPGGTTLWCSVADFGMAGCPMVLADARAFRFRAPGPLELGETGTIEVVMSPTGNVHGDLYTNNYGGRVEGITLPVVSNDVTINVVSIVDVDLVKEVIPDDPTVGDTVTFILRVSNAVDVMEATNVEVTDVVMPGFLYEPGSIGGGDERFENEPVLRWRIDNLLPGESVELTFRAEVTRGGMLRNYSEVTSTDQPDRDSTPSNGDDGQGPDEDDDDEVLVVSFQPTPAPTVSVWGLFVVLFLLIELTRRRTRRISISEARCRC